MSSHHVYVCIECGERHDARPRQGECQNCEARSIVDLADPTEEEIQRAIRGAQRPWWRRFRRDVFVALFLALIPVVLFVVFVVIKAKPEPQSGITSTTANDAPMYFWVADPPSFESEHHEWLRKATAELSAQTMAVADCMMDVGVPPDEHFTVMVRFDPARIEVRPPQTPAPLVTCVQELFAESRSAISPAPPGIDRIEIPAAIVSSRPDAVRIAAPGRFHVAKK